MHELSSHKLGSLNSALRIVGLGLPGPGGAYQHYEITSGDELLAVLHFQQGNPEEKINGISNEALLTIVADRLECFQQGDFAHIYNGVALTRIRQALVFLEERTRERIERNIEGTQQK